MPNMDPQPYDWYSKPQTGAKSGGVGKPLYGDRHPSEPASEHYPAPNKGMLSEIFGGHVDVNARLQNDLDTLREEHRRLKELHKDLQRQLAEEKAKPRAEIHNHYHTYSQPVQVDVANPKPTYHVWPINPQWNSNSLW